MNNNSNLFNKRIYLIGKDSKGILYYLNYNINYITNKDCFCQIEKDNYTLNILFINDYDVVSGIDLYKYFDIVYCYESIYKEFLNKCNSLYFKSYDYNFLKTEFDSALTDEFDTLIVGSSYSLSGIDKTLLSKKAFNLSMHSQDLYYSYKLAKECILNNKSIKKCILGMGYYVMHYDLSKSDCDYAKDKVKNTYAPLLGDYHNSDVEPSDNLRLIDYIDDIVLKDIFYLDGIENYIYKACKKIYPKYFNDIAKREDISYLKGINLTELTEYEKKYFSTKRFYSHNKFIRYDETFNENLQVFDEFLRFFNDNNVEIILICFPFTKYYLDGLNPVYKTTFHKILDIFKKYYKFRFIDFNEIGYFDEGDFQDFDHLGERGCIKITNYLNEYICGK